MELNHGGEELAVLITPVGLGGQEGFNLHF